MSTTSNLHRLNDLANAKGDPRHAFEVEEAPRHTAVDRSTLEAYATCPFLGSAIERGDVSTVGAIAVSGDLAHQAMMSAVRLWIELNGQVSLTDLRAEVENAMVSSRPDLQPDVISAVQRDVWDWCLFVRSLRPDEIEAFDGGEHVAKADGSDLSGQLAIPLDRSTDYTLEIDFLHRGPSPDVLHIKDLKTGWKEMDAGAVAQSFQFQSQALVVMENYPSVQAVEVEIRNTRLHRFSRRVVFERRDIGRYKARVIQAQAARLQALTTEPECWPTAEKCPICPCARICPAVDRVTKDLALISDGDLLNVYHAAEAKAEAIKKALTQRVDAKGADIVSGTSAFGRNKPAASRKAPVALYSIKGSDED